jgi:hypothetical protein
MRLCKSLPILVAIIISDNVDLELGCSNDDDDDDGGDLNESFFYDTNCFF